MIKKTDIEWTDVTWKISTGCKHGCPYCYVKRFMKDMTPKFWYNRLEDPFKLKKPSMIFVANTGDLFGEWNSKVDIKAVLKVIEKCPQHIFQILTKNAVRLSSFYFPDNCWVGTSVESQDKIDRLIHLRLCEAKTKFVSFEPLLGPIECDLTGLVWVIIGPESVGNANTPKDPEKAKEWAKPLVEQVRKAGIPLFIKPCGEWWPEKIEEMPK